MLEPFSPEYWKEMYELRGKWPVMWWVNAEALKSSADIILRDSQDMINNMYTGKPDRNTSYSSEETEKISVYLMLAGMSIENLLKGILVNNIPEIIDNGKLQPKWQGDGHGLEDIGKLTGLSFSEQEQQILKTLSGYIRWAGRYPIPKKYSPNPIEDYPAPFTPLLPPQINALFSRLASYIKPEHVK